MIPLCNFENVNIIMYLESSGGDTHLVVEPLLCPWLSGQPPKFWFFFNYNDNFKILVKNKKVEKIINNQ